MLKGAAGYEILRGRCFAERLGSAPRSGPSRRPSPASILRSNARNRLRTTPVYSSSSRNGIRGWSSKCTERVGLGVIRSRVRQMRVVVQRVLESLGRAPQSRCDRPPRSHTRVTAHLPPTSISPPKRPAPYNNAMAASVVGLCKTVPIREKGPWRDLDRLEYVDWFSHRRPRPPKPNASPCLPPPSPPGTPPTSVQLSTTGYQHINLHRRYDVTNTTTPPPGQLRPLTAAQTDAFCTDAGSTPSSRALFDMPS